MTVGAVAWHIKPYSTPHHLSSMVEEETAGKEDIFCSLRWQQKLKMGMMAAFLILGAAGAL